MNVAEEFAQRLELTMESFGFDQFATFVYQERDYGVMDRYGRYSVFRELQFTQKIDGSVLAGGNIAPGSDEFFFQYIDYVARSLCDSIIEHVKVDPNGHRLIRVRWLPASPAEARENQWRGDASWRGIPIRVDLRVEQGNLFIKYFCSIAVEEST